jgi:hypothetical protein
MSSRGRVVAEVAVVAGIVLLTAGMVLPAVNKVRDAAHRAACQNSVRQLMLALINYAEQNPAKQRSAFPAGTIDVPGIPPERRLSWCVEVIPYIEATDLHTRFDPTAPADAPRNRAAGDATLNLFVCRASPDVDGDRRATAPVLYYVGLAGVGPDAATLPAGDPRAGVFGYDRRTPLADITDGTANTVALIEVTANPGRWADGGPGTVRGLDPASAPHVGRHREFGGLHAVTRSPFGPSRTAAMVGMADGSVRVLPEGTATEVVEALATAAGKESLPAEW